MTVFAQTPVWILGLVAVVVLVVFDVVFARVFV